MQGERSGGALRRNACWSPKSAQARVVCLAFVLVCWAPLVVSRNERFLGGVVEQFGPLKTLGGWQLPEEPPTKVFVLIPGGEINPQAYFDHSSICPTCTGLPETRKIVKDAIAIRYAVFVLQVCDTRPDHEPVDDWALMNFLAIFSDWKLAHGLENLPIVGQGTSCGGFAIYDLGFMGLFESIALMVSSGGINVTRTPDSTYPPTMFLHMPKDAGTAANIAERRRQMEAVGVPSLEVKWFEQPVTADWFAQFIPGVDLALSAALQEAARADGWLEDGTDLLKSDAYKDDWDNTIKRWDVLPPDPLVKDHLMFQESVLQELNVAYAFHVTFCRMNRHMFAWFEGGYDDKNHTHIARADFAVM